MKVVLTIAGSDCSGGAGIQADLKTILAHGAYGMSVVTALTAQNTTGVFGVLKTDAAFIGTQLDAVFRDLRPDAVKIGMIADAQAVQMISDKLRTYQAGKIVVDTVLTSTSGTRLTGEEALACAKEELFPLASLLTPNLKEAETLAGIPVTDKTSMQLAADRIAGMFGCAVLIKKKRGIVFPLIVSITGFLLELLAPGTADICMGRQMTCCIRMGNIAGCMRGGWIIQIRMVPAVRCLLRLPVIWQKACGWRTPYTARRLMLRMQLQTALLSAQEEGR